MNTEIQPAELFDLLQSETKLCLLDVREAEELQLASLDNPIHIPLMSLPERLGELAELIQISSFDSYVLICRSGQRSEMARQWLVAQGFDQFRNLVGGINAYAKLCDPSIQPY